MQLSRLNFVRTEQFIYKDLTIGYAIYGNGHKIMLAFHGFNQNSSSFSSLFNQHKLSDFTIYSIGLFHHESQFPNYRLPKEPLTTQELAEIVQLFCQAKSIDKYSLMGYSIGARICLSLLVAKHDDIQKVILLAPDGLKMKFGYYFLMHTWLGMRLFRRSQKYIKISLKFAEYLFLVRLISKTEMKMVKNAMENPETIYKVWATWNTYKKLYPSKNLWIESVNSNRVDALFVFGKYDKVISQKSLNSLKRKLKDKRKIHVLSCGHNFLNPQTIEKIAELI